MINWTDIKNLHVIAKLDEIIGNWFGVELFYADEHGKLKSDHLDKNFDFKSHFFKVATHLNYGSEFLNQDIEKVTDFFKAQKDDVWVFDSFFPHVKGIAAKVESEGEYLGSVFGFPFLLDTVEQSEVSDIVTKLVALGASEEDANACVEKMARLSSKQVDYLKQLAGLAADEIVTFYEEITKREFRILELNSELTDKFRHHSIIGKAKTMQAIYSLLQKIAGSEASVFIHGDNGTGKELVAKAIHFDSPRKNNVFYAVNCSAFNDNLLDSELFGHVKGAFTGAIKDKKGLFEMANGGTLFLDEIGDTSLSMQVKLLRVLQEGTFLPVGATTPRKVDVRVIAATNRNLKEMMAKGEFREDLFYRINVINVNLPSLKERKEDISLLADYFLTKRCAEGGMAVKTISKKCMEKMFDYTWPGNVRELENEIERLVVLSGEDKIITPDLLSPRIQESFAGPANQSGGDSSGVPSGGAGVGINFHGNLKKALEQVEIIMIREGLRRCDFNKSKLSKELGISRASLIMKVDKYDLDKRKKAVGE